MSVTGIIAWAGGAGGAFAFFSKFDDLANKNTKRDMSAILKRNAAQSAVDQQLTVFNRLFTHIYGSRYISLRFVVASGTTTFVVVLSLYTIELLEGWTKFDWHSQYPERHNITPIGLSYLVTMALIYSMPIDFLGLIKSRAVLSAINSNNAVVLLILDFLASIGLSLGGFLVLDTLLGGGTTDFKQDILHYYPKIISSVTLASPIIWSTLTTSIWAAIYYISIYMLRSSSKVLYFINRFFDVDKKPFSTLGFAAAGLISLVSVAATII